MTRKYTKALLEARDDRLITDKDIVRACLNYMTEAEVEDMVIREELLPWYQLEELRGGPA